MAAPQTGAARPQMKRGRSHRAPDAQALRVAAALGQIAGGDGGDSAEREGEERRVVLRSAPGVRHGDDALAGGGETALACRSFGTSRMAMIMATPKNTEKTTIGRISHAVTRPTPREIASTMNARPS